MFEMSSPPRANKVNLHRAVHWFVWVLKGIVRSITFNVNGTLSARKTLPCWEFPSPEQDHPIWPGQFPSVEIVGNWWHPIAYHKSTHTWILITETGTSLKAGKGKGKLSRKRKSHLPPATMLHPGVRVLDLGSPQEERSWGRELLGHSPRVLS